MGRLKDSSKNFFEIFQKFLHSFPKKSPPEVPQKKNSLMILSKNYLKTYNLYEIIQGTRLGGPLDIPSKMLSRIVSYNIQQLPSEISHKIPSEISQKTLIENVPWIAKLL